MSNKTPKYIRYRKKKPNYTIEIVSLVVAVLLVCCAYAGSINPEKFFPAPFLMLAFMPMFILTVILLLGVLLWRRWLSMLVLIVALLVVLPITKKYIPFNTSETALPTPADRQMVLKVMTYNVLAFNFNDPSLNSTPSASMRLILDVGPDVVLLQEGTAGGLDWIDMPSVLPYKAQIDKKYPYHYSSADGLSIMSKYPFTTTPIGEPYIVRSPLGYNRNQMSYIARAYDLELPYGKQLCLINFRLQSYNLSFGQTKHVRVSPEVKPSPLDRMKRSFAQRGHDATNLRQAIDASPANVIACGDMNDVTASYVYRVISGKDMRDAWCDVGVGYSYTYNRHQLRYRIDHVMYRGDVRALEAERFTGGSSDHYPLMVTFDIDVSSRHSKTVQE